MKHPRQIGRAPRDHPQRALAVQRLEPVEQLSGNFQIKIDPEPNPDQFIHFARTADRESAWTNSRERQIGFFPHRQSAHIALVKLFVTLHRADDLRNIAAVFNQDKLANGPDVRARRRPGDSERVSRQIERRHSRGWADQSIPHILPDIGLLLLPPFREIVALKLFGINR